MASPRQTTRDSTACFAARAFVRGRQTSAIGDKAWRHYTVMLMRWTKEARSERFASSVRTRIVFAMKNISFALLLPFVASLSACSSTQEATTTETTPMPTVTVPVEKTPDPVADKPKEDKPATPEETTPPEETPRPGGRLALQQCSESSRKMKACTKELVPVCGEVDTGIRCVRAPCPSTIQQTFPNACNACADARVRGYWTMSCEDMGKPTAP